MKKVWRHADGEQQQQSETIVISSDEEDVEVQAASLRVLQQSVLPREYQAAAPRFRSVDIDASDDEDDHEY